MEIKRPVWNTDDRVKILNRRSYTNPTGLPDMTKGKLNRNLMLTGSIVCCLAVVLGAFGAHALKGVINEWYDAETAIKKLDSWETGIRYQMFHGLAFLVLACLTREVLRPRFLKLTAVFFAVGIVIFSGGLYLWVLTDIKPFVIAVPLGGFSYILGWVCLACSVSGNTVADDGTERKSENQ